MCLRLEIERARLSPRAHDDVVCGAATLRYGGMRNIRQRHQQQRPLLLDLIELDAELPYLLRPLAVGFENRGRVLPLALGARHFISRRVLLALQPLELGDEATAAVLQHGELFELAVDNQAAGRQPALHVLLMIAHVRRIEHDEILSDMKFLSVE